MNSLENKKVLVTGGCGFIGSHLVEHVLACGAASVAALDSMEYGVESNLVSAAKDPRLSVITHRLGSQSGGFLDRVLEGVQVVFHLAAEKHNQSVDNPRKVLDANVQGTFELLQACVHQGVKKVVFSSSLYAYGRMEGEPFGELEQPIPHTVYGISKLTGEHLCRHFYKKFGLESVCLRFFFVYGPRQFANSGYKSVIVKNFERLLAGQCPTVCGDGCQKLDYVYVRDVVEALEKAALSDVAYSVLNIGSGVGTSVNELVMLMKDISGTPRPVEFIEKDSTHGSCRVGRTQEAERVLGWKAHTPLRDGLASTFDWMKSARR